MKALFRVDASVPKDTSTAQPPLKVCMHLMGRSRPDIRLMRTATALVKVGFAVSIIDVESVRTCPVEEEISGIQIHHLIEPSWYTARRFEPWFFVKAVQTFIRSVLWLIRMPVDIYHASDLSALPACYIAAKVRRKPFIFESYELPASVPETKIVFWRWFGWLLLRLLAVILPGTGCAGIIAASPSYAQEMRRLYCPADVTLIRNVPEYRTVAKSDWLRQHLGLPSNVRIALYQGNLQPDRGLDRLIRAAAFLERDIIIVLMGKGMGGTLDQLESLVVSEGVADRVRIIPPVPYEELLDWTASADIGLIVYSPDHSLSVRLMQPNKLFEYLMAGLPVLSSSLDAVVEVIRTYDVGQVVPSLSPADVGGAISTMLADHEALARMRRNALEAAHEFCWERESQQLIRLYQERCSGTIVN